MDPQVLTLCELYEEPLRVLFRRYATRHGTRVKDAALDRAGFLRFVDDFSTLRAIDFGSAELQRIFAASRGDHRSRKLGRTSRAAGAWGLGTQLNGSRTHARFTACHSDSWAERTGRRGGRSGSGHSIMKYCPSNAQTGRLSRSAPRMCALNTKRNMLALCRKARRRLPRRRRTRGRRCCPSPTLSRAWRGSPLRRRPGRSRCAPSSRCCLRGSTSTSRCLRVRSGCDGCALLHELLRVAEIQSTTGGGK
ncbi:hypothetical protein JKP88DRAFT_232061 [Tribonema minus]|uniref:Uncharacterized protein n=1 Tax=Tribonema minus TaxID=303371 RepID=A0A836CL73_9STRA|nr:hypothetical protein JKP88DRAFT_232061 [Tribonema minus]